MIRRARPCLVRWWAGHVSPPPGVSRWSWRVTPPSRRAAALTALLLLLSPAGEADSQPHRPAQAGVRATSVVPNGGVVRLKAPGDFPHAAHARLFATCESCHADVAQNTTAGLFPSPTSCVSCHNGTDAKRVEWRAPVRPAPQGLLAFSHQRHFASDTTSRSCTTCHAGSTGKGFMDVKAARSATCFGCHAHQAPSHYDPANACRTCHVPLTAARGVDLEVVRRLPKPATHEARGFIAAHAPGSPAAAATCATCHARESCARCHLNVAALPVAAALARDQRVAEITRGLAPAWPVPDTHQREDFVQAHGASAAAPGATCANCHARSSCATCHTGPGARKVIQSLSEPSSAPRGVQLRRPVADARGRAGSTVAVARIAADTLPQVVRPHPRNFVEAHRTVASAGQQTCEGCHTQRFCSDCHAGESRRAFHPPNFSAGHAASTYARDRECASCHNTEVFCRACHQASGLQAAGRNAATYHNAQPQWLLQHGRAARLELASCTTCHTQATCMRCHATTGWGVNPHGRDFDADRLGRKAMAMCARCHITDPRRPR